MCYRQPQSLSLTSPRASDTLRRSLGLGLGASGKSRRWIRPGNLVTSETRNRKTSTSRPQEGQSMKTIASCLLGTALLYVGMGVAAAQETMPPPKVLLIDREFTKPGKGASVHDKSESACAEAF